MRVLVGDCEVFKHYFLFVANDISTNETVVIEDRDSLVKYYHQNIDSIWVFYNAEYDRHILKAVLLGNHNPYVVSQQIIHENKRPYEIFSRDELMSFPMICYDAKTTSHGLKRLEAFMGEDICETTIPFNYPNKLSRTQKDEIIYYCKHDVEQTCKVLKHIKPAFTSHLAVCKEFKLPLHDNLHRTMPKLAEVVLMGNARGRQSFNDEFGVQLPKRIKLCNYRYVQNWFEQELAKGRSGEIVYGDKLECDVAGVPHVFAWGGVHGALPKFKTTGNLIMVDVQSYYPSMIIKFGFHSRNWTNPALYDELFNTRIELKAKKDPRQLPYKLALNSSYGLLKDKNSRSYDPRMANSICLTGQLMLLMLMERVEESGCARLIQSNSDGVLYEYYNLDEFRSICQQWQVDTGMKLEEDFYHTIIQKDVNNYILVGDMGVKCKGILFKNKTPIDNDCPIIQRALIDYFVKGIPPAETVNKSNELIDFQIVKSKPSCFNNMQLNGVIYDLKYYRLFAARGRGYRNPVWISGDKTSRVSGAPESCAIDNSNIIGVSCPQWLDKEWYIHKVNEIIFNLGLSNRLI